MGLQKMNVHEYDGKLSVQHLPLRIVSIEEQKECGRKLLDLNLSDVAKRYLSQIIVDLGTAANRFDSTLTADDLIVLCVDHCDNKDFVEMLSVQLEDMATGFCPAGRTHRIFQLLVAFSS